MTLHYVPALLLSQTVAEFFLKAFVLVATSYRQLNIDLL